MDNLGYLGALCGRFADVRILDGCEPGVPRNRRLDPGRRWPPPASSRIQGPGPGKEVCQGVEIEEKGAGQEQERCRG